MTRSVIFLVDHERPSYVEAADLYREAFAALALAVDVRPYAPAQCEAPGAWVLHHTIGPLFRPVEGAHNTAVVFHEWDRYPRRWVRTLDAFQSIWAPSTHVALALRASGVRTPIHFVPPPVAARRVPAKTAWSTYDAFRFLSIGEAHFRKGFHLLIDGFLQAFPDEGEATLTLKVSPSCSWRSPRADIRIVADRIERGRLLSLYASHDAYVTASLGEGLGLPLAEAIVAGLPVVANHWGGHRDLMRREHGWTIGHEVVPQVFCSDPAYYAKGQCCAYSSPERIAEALRAAVDAAPSERESRARHAAAALQASHGLLPVGSIVLDRYGALVSDGTDVVADALTR